MAKDMNIIEMTEVTDEQLEMVTGGYGMGGNIRIEKSLKPPVGDSSPHQRTGVFLPPMTHLEFLHWAAI